MSSVSCSLIFGDTATGPVPVPVIVNYDEGVKEIDSTGTQGDDVRVVITSGNTVVETTPSEPNTGANQIDYTTVLQNGDRLCVQASYDSFASFVQACKTIPTPEFGFVPVT